MSPLRLARVKTIHPEFLDHCEGQRHFYLGWNELLDDHFLDLPPGFTANHWFQFEQGSVAFRQRCDSEEETRFTMCKNHEATRSALIEALFGTEDRSQRSMKNLKLPTNPGLVLKEKKLISLGKKLSTIPFEYRGYYPTTQDAEEPASSLDGPAEHPPEISKRKVGRPRRIEKDPNQPSILKFFNNQIN